MRTITNTEPTIRDKARELVSVAEGEILKREATILALRQEVAQLKRELKEVKDPRLDLPRPADCEHCTYRVIAIRHLEEEK